MKHHHDGKAPVRFETLDVGDYFFLGSVRRKLPQTPVGTSIAGHGQRCGVVNSIEVENGTLSGVGDVVEVQRLDGDQFPREAPTIEERLEQVEMICGLRPHGRLNIA